MADSSYSILSQEDASYAFIITICRPDGVVYKTWSTDQLDGVGDASSIASSSSFNNPPTNFSNILMISLPMRLILSRQICGWKATIHIQMTQPGTVQTIKKMFEAYIGEITVQGNKANVELISPSQKLSKPSRYILSTSCTREFGDSKCGVNTQSQFIPVTELSDSLITVSEFYNFLPGISYECVIGDDSFTITDVSAYPNISLNRSPLARPDVVEIKKACDRKITTCRKYENTDRFLGSKLPANQLSLTL